jgi:hypothetical protein
MTQLYSEGQWVSLAYTPAQLTSQPGLTTTVLTIK